MDSSKRVNLGAGGEFDLIRQLMGREHPLPEGVLLGPGDDCAVLEGGVVVSTDLAVEGVHFRRDWVTLEEAGYRAGAAALSDLASMAAEPVGVLVAMALGPSRPRQDAGEVQRGVAEACALEGVQVLGGDLAGSPGPLMLNIVALGRSGAPVLRSGSEVGDEVWVTGRLGGSGGAVALWNQGRVPPAELREAFTKPRPRIREARWLAARAPLHGLIDLSDGLAGDAGHLAAASGVSLVLHAESIPIHPFLRDVLGSAREVPQYPDREVTRDLGESGTETASLGAPLHFSLRGGEDYELCFTVPPGALDGLADLFRSSFGIPLTKVGRVDDGEGVFLEGAGGKVSPLITGGFNHFSAEEED